LGERQGRSHDQRQESAEGDHWASSHLILNFFVETSL
jgi:hypothetical protein